MLLRGVERRGGHGFSVLSIDARSPIVVVGINVEHASPGIL